VSDKGKTHRQPRNMLVAALGSYGDVFPMVGIAAQLKHRGHRVKLFTHAHYAYLADNHDLDCIGLDTELDYERFANHPDLFDTRKAFSVFMKTVVLPNLRKTYNALITHIQPGNTIIIAPMIVFAARLIQEKFGTPMVTVHTIPMQIKSAYEIPKVAGRSIPEWSPVWLVQFYWWVADKIVIDPLICPELNRFRKNIGLKPVKRVMTKWVHSPERVISMYPTWFATPQPDWPPSAVNTGFPLFDEGDENELADEVRAFLSAKPPPVVFMPGSLMQQASKFFIQSKKACEILGCRGIFLSRYAEQIPDQLPESIRHFSYVPFRQLLPHCAVLVHHGGIGTTAQALRAGVPQLIHPLAYDQFDNAARIQKLGVGKVIIPDEYQADVVAETLEKLMNSPDIQQHCRDIVARFDNVDPLQKTCDFIEETLP
jgi:rhamnosyltransferase subunit B